MWLCNKEISVLMGALNYVCIITLEELNHRMKIKWI